MSTFKNKNLKIQEVGKELGVRYILEGSVRKVGSRIRINAQLIDAGSGGHLWAERYDRALVDIFDLQDEVTREIVEALTLNPSYADALAGLADIFNWTGNSEKAIPLMKRAMYLNPHHHAWYNYVLGVSYIFVEQHEKTVDTLKRGLVRQPNFLGIHSALAGLYAEMDRIKDAKTEIDEVLRLSPEFTLQVLREMLPLKDPVDRERLLKAVQKAGRPE